MPDALFSRYGREFQKGHTLFHEGEPGQVMYVIQTGVVRITKRIGSDNKILALLGPGEFVGEMALLNAKPRTATATVIEGPARCLVLDAQTLEIMLAKNAEIAIRLIKKLSKRLDSADTLVEILMHRDPKARVLLSLARHAEGDGEPHPDGILVRATVAELASQVGVEPKVADELFMRLRRLKLAHDSPDGLVVTDLERLQDFIGFLEKPQGTSPST